MRTALPGVSADFERDPTTKQRGPISPRDTSLIDRLDVHMPDIADDRVGDD